MTSRNRDKLFESLRRLILEDAAASAGSSCDQEDAPGSDPWEGRRMGRYLLAEMIGEGASSKVYWALHVDLQKPVAVKVLKDSASIGTPDWERFRREALTAANLDHPGIIAVHDVDHTGDVPFIAMDFVEGPTLRRWAESEEISLDERVHVLQRTAEAVAHAHDRNVIHRDLKSDNVLVNPSGHPVVVDFGLARVPSDPRRTTEGSPLGTPSYMAPEQVRGELDRVGTRTDIYSLGVMLFEALTGTLPFEGAGIDEVYHQIIGDLPPAPSTRRATVPGELDAICLKCLEKDPRDRYATAGDLARDLEHFRRGEPVSARPRSRVSVLLRRLRRHPIRVAVTALVLVALLVGGSIGLEALEERRILRDALVIQKSCSEATTNLHHLIVAAADGRHGDRSTREELLEKAEVILAQIDDSMGVAEGFRSWIRFLARDASGATRLRAARVDHPDNPLLHLFAAKILLFAYVENCTWPPFQMALYPTRNQLRVPAFEESEKLADYRSSALKAVDSARASPLWAHLALGWVTHLADAIDAYARNDMKSCVVHLEQLRNRSDLDIECGLLGALARYRLGDLDGALKVATELCERRPAFLLARRNLAGITRIHSMRALGQGADTRPALMATRELYRELAPVFDTRGDLAEVEYLIGSAADRGGESGDPWYARAVELYEKLIEDSPLNHNHLMNQAAALGAMSRLSPDAVPLLERAVRSAKRAKLLRPDDRLVVFHCILAELNLLKRTARSSSIQDTVWAALDESIDHCRELGLGKQELLYAEAMQAFAHGEAELWSKRDPIPLFRASCSSLTQMLDLDPRITEARQLWIIAAMKLHDAESAPDVAEVLQVVDNVKQLFSESKRYLILDRFFPPYLDRMTRKLTASGATTDPRSVGEAAVSAWEARVRRSDRDHRRLVGLARSRETMVSLEPAAAVRWLKDAISAYTRAAELQSEDAAPHIGLVRCLASLVAAEKPKPRRMRNLLDDALSHARKAVTLDPESAQALIQRGKIYLVVGDRDQATEDLDAAERLAKGNVGVLREIKRIRLMMR